MLQARKPLLRIVGAPGLPFGSSSPRRKKHLLGVKYCLPIPAGVI